MHESSFSEAGISGKSGIERALAFANKRQVRIGWPRERKVFK